MKSKRKEEPYPLKKVNQLAESDPEIWNILESMQKRMETENGKNTGTLALAEIGRAYLLYKEAKRPSGLTKNQAASFGLEIASLFRWRKHKIFLDYDPDMANELYMQANDLKVPSKILKSLPYDSFYMTLPGIDAESVFGFEKSTIEGVFVTREQSERKGNDIQKPYHADAVRFCIVGEKGQTKPVPFAANFIIEINDKTIEENLPTKILTGKTKESKKTNLDIMDQLYRKLITLVMYTCARNKDITRKPGTEKRTKRTGEIRDRYYEVEEYDVGTRVATALKIDFEKADMTPLTDGMDDPWYGIPQRQEDRIKDPDIKEEAPEEEEETAKAHTKAAHIRRGHWHHYWTGPRSDKESRIPILHWLPPMAVGITKNNAENTTIRPVTPKKKTKSRAR